MNYRTGPLLLTVPPPGTWIALGACRGEPVGEWVPAKDRVEDRHRARCASCPVAVPCLAYAVAHPALWGIWAGTSHKERTSMRSKGRRTVEGTESPDGEGQRLSAPPGGLSEAI